MAGKPWFYTVRKHLKKSIFVSLLASYGVVSAVDKYREYILRRYYCSKVISLGHECVDALQLPRRFHLILNSQASSGNGTKLFEKNAAPLLHLAGIDIVIIKTNYEGHAKAIVGYIDPNTDGIIVAGGDGTVQEVVTGLMREKDQSLRNIPIGIIPLGKENNSFSRLFNRRSRQVERIGEATLGIIKGEVDTADVLEVSTGKRKSYALNSIYWGAFRNVKDKIDRRKHWWVDPWKKMTFVTSTLKGWPSITRSQFAFNNLQGNDSSISKPPVLSQATSLEKAGNEHLSEMETPALKSDLHTTDAPATNSNVTPTALATPSLQPKHLDSMAIHVSLSGKEVNGSNMVIQIWNPEMSRVDFIKDGWNWIRANYQPFNSPFAESYPSDSFELKPLSDEGSFYNIDGELFEAIPISVCLLKKSLKVFCSC